MKELNPTQMTDISGGVLTSTDPVESPAQTIGLPTAQATTGQIKIFGIPINYTK